MHAMVQSRALGMASSSSRSLLLVYRTVLQVRLRDACGFLEVRWVIERSDEADLLM